MALITLLRFLGWTVLLAPIQTLLIQFRLPITKRLPMIWHRGVCRIFAFRLAVLPQHHQGE